MESSSGSVVLASADGGQSSGDMIVKSVTSMYKIGSLTWGSGSSTISSEESVTISLGYGKSGTGGPIWWL